LYFPDHSKKQTLYNSPPTQKPMIIIVTGWARSGKDTLAEVLEEKYKFKHYDFTRDILTEEIKKRGLEVTKDNASKVAIAMRQETNNNGIMGKLLAEKINPKENAVVTGSRSPEELDEFKKVQSNILLIAVDADQETRFERRTENDSNNLQEFLERDRRDDQNSGMGKVVNQAKIRISNNDSLESFEKKIDDLMKTL
jgi:dephospho-CoA kinase